VKKFLIASVAAVSLLGLAACNDKKDDTSNAPAPSAPAAPSNNDTTTTPAPATPAPATPAPGTGTAPSN
jgi:predicted outer membrane protein